MYIIIFLGAWHFFPMLINKKLCVVWGLNLQFYYLLYITSVKLFSPYIFFNILLASFFKYKNIEIQYEWMNYFFLKMIPKYNILLLHYLSLFLWH